MTDYLFSKNPIVFSIGFFILFSLPGCETKKTPIETAQAFWSAMAKNNIDHAKTFCSSQSQNLPSPSNIKLAQSSFSFGKITIEGTQATVESQITTSSNKAATFTTFLVKENKLWKIDCARSASEISGNHLVKKFLKNLNDLGENLNRQLEQQLPLIEKEIESFGQELKEQLDHLGNELKKSIPQKQQNPYQDTI